MSGPIFGPRKQSAKATNGNITQVGRDYIHASNMKIGIWISIMTVLIFAIATSAFIRLKGENWPDIEIELQDESVPSSKLQE